MHIGVKVRLTNILAILWSKSESIKITEKVVIPVSLFMQVAKPWQGSDDHLLENVVLSPGVEIKGRTSSVNNCHAKCIDS